MARLFQIGDVVAGKYRVERILGEGGHGVVLGARNIALDEPVAVKVLKPEALENQESVARFLREARAAVRIRGEHVARVLDVGSLDDGTPYMLMEQLDGADLSKIVERDGVLPVQTAVEYVLQACEALAEAHALGIVHRDIKPANLFLTYRVDGTPCVKVLDFGISKATNAIDATRPDFGLTQTQTIMGSPQYMAPEQMRSSRRVDGRTDIWALGTIMHELLTGEPPFSANTMPELFAIILEDPAPSLRAKRPDVPPELDAVVMRCLSKKAEGRPESVLELARLLGPFGGALSPGTTDRIARVVKNVAATSASNIESVLAAGTSVPEMAHTRTTTRDRVTLPSKTRRVLGALALGFGVISVAFVLTFFVRARVPRGTPAGLIAPAATSAFVDVPPLLDLPPPPSTTTAPEEAPSTAASAGRTPKRPHNPTHRPPASAGASSPPPVHEAVPASTASSRYD